MKYIIILFVIIFSNGCVHTNNQQENKDLLAIIKEAEKGNLQSQRFLAVYYSGTDDYQLQKESFKWMLKLAEQNITAAQVLVAEQYATGTGTPKNYPEAIKWYKRAAANNVAAAQFQLAKMYANGWGVRQNHKESFRLLLLAANQGIKEAQILVANSYMNGIGTSKNMKNSKEWFGIVCDNGTQIGCDMYKLLNSKGF